jgi:hypothetical protein
MEPFPSEGTSHLEWVQPRSLEHYFELRSKDDLVATLGWESMLSYLARVETAHGTWTLELLGILNQRVEVREADTQLLVGDYYPGLMGNGVLELADGRKLKWESTNFWGTDWAFFDGSGCQTVVLREGVAGARWRDMLKTQYTVSMDEAGWTPEELALLAALGLYLIIWQRQAAAGAVAASAAVVG